MEKVNINANGTQNSAVPEEFDKAGYRYLVNQINLKTGLDVSYYRDNFLKRRLLLKMGEKNIKSCMEYATLIKHDKEEMRELFEFITVNYTRFYRDREVFDFFNMTILPEIARKKNTLRLLSAGCSTGEEPYTLAILLKEYCRKAGIPDKGSIHAVDVDRAVLDKAILGKYGEDSLSSLKKSFIRNYFDHENGVYTVSDELKRKIRFGIQDITKPLAQRHFDVIFCRNVFIYFNNEAKTQIIENFYNALNDEGYLIIGKTEVMPQETRHLYHSVRNKLKIFQKK